MSITGATSSFTFCKNIMSTTSQSESAGNTFTVYYKLKAYKLHSIHADDIHAFTLSQYVCAGKLQTAPPNIVMSI